jgi:hypothetical protein
MPRPGHSWLGAEVLHPGSTEDRWSADVRSCFSCGQLFRVGQCFRLHVAIAGRVEGHHASRAVREQEAKDPIGHRARRRSSGTTRPTRPDDWCTARPASRPTRAACGKPAAQAGSPARTAGTTLPSRAVRPRSREHVRPPRVASSCFPLEGCYQRKCAVWTARPRRSQRLHRRD